MTERPSVEIVLSGKTAIYVFDVTGTLHGKEGFPDFRVGYHKIQCPLHSLRFRPGRQDGF